MPLPSPSGKEKRKSFVSRCVADLTRKGEGDSAAQRVAICNSRYEKSKAEESVGKNKKKDKRKKIYGEVKGMLDSITKEELDALRKVMGNENIN